MKVVIVDYGMGNLASVSRAIAELGAHAVIAADPDELQDADRIILPGVGSFADGMSRLAEHGWCGEIRRRTRDDGVPLLGICLGMQLLATRGTEGGIAGGLDLVPGEVVRLDTLGCTLRVPHVGWNSVSLANSHPALFSGIPNDTDFYFVHSFGFQPRRAEDVLARTEYGVSIVAAVGAGRVFGTQFHPEKSSKAGLRLLKNFLDAMSC